MIWVAAMIAAASPEVTALWATPPRPLSGMITTSDYPPAALRREAQGTTHARLTINASGTVDRCRIVRSSGHPDLDRRVCDLSLVRLKFGPALDAAGKAIAVDAILPVRWVLAD